MPRPGSTTVSDASLALVAALQAVEFDGGDAGPQLLGTGRVLMFGDALPGGPAAVLGPPVLGADSYGSGFTTATFPVFAVVDSNDRAQQYLWIFVDAIRVAIDSGSNGAVTRADPGLFSSGQTQLPCYEITVEYPL